MTTSSEDCEKIEKEKDELSALIKEKENQIMAERRQNIEFAHALDEVRKAKTNLEQEYQKRKKDIAELKINNETQKMKLIKVQNDYADHKTQTDIIIKKYLYDIKELKKQYSKEKLTKEVTIKENTRLQEELNLLTEKFGFLERKSMGGGSVTNKEKKILESLSSKVEELQVNNIYIYIYNKYIG